MLPGEEETRAKVRQHHEQEFALADELLQVAHEALRKLCAVQVQRDGERPKMVCVAVLTRLLQQYLSVAVLCEVGLVRDADILVRAMFELRLFVLFLLKEEKGLHLPEKTPTPPQGGLTVTFRAQLIVAKIANDREKWLQKAQSKRQGFVGVPQDARDNAKELLNEARTAVSNTWMEWICKGPGSHVEQMAKILNLNDEYNILYRGGSLSAHGIDIDEFLVEDRETGNLVPRLWPDVDGASGPLHVTGVHMLHCLSEINNHFGLSLDSNLAAIDQRLLSK